VAGRHINKRWREDINLQDFSPANRVSISLGPMLEMHDKREGVKWALTDVGWMGVNTVVRGELEGKMYKFGAKEVHYV
jgi:hypothetical protein